MNLTWSLAYVGLYVICSAGCCATRFPEGQTPINEVIVANKHALVKAGEKLVFEEFVKYKEIGFTFALYRISSATIEVSTQISTTKTNAVNAGVSLSPTPGGQFGASTTITVNNQESGNLTITLSPIADSLKVYKEVQSIFETTDGRGYIYNVYFSNTGSECNKETYENNYCFTFNMKDDQGKYVVIFAYIKDMIKFRELLDKLRKIYLQPYS